MAENYTVAIVGATGNVGRELLTILAERAFPADRVLALASRRSLGREVSFGDDVLRCESLEDVDFAGIDLCLMSAGAEVARVWAPRFAEAGAVVIDNSSFWRNHAQVPLIVPEVNADVLDKYMARPKRLNIIANPNCSTSQLVVALKPIHDLAKIRRVVIATYQSVSGAGKSAMDELWDQTKSIYMPDKAIDPKYLPRQIAFNVIPKIDVFMDDGGTREEWKMLVETKKILDPKIRLSATAVRVPVFVGHAEAVNLELASPLGADEARELLREAPGCLVVDNPQDDQYITPVDCVGDYATYISRIREDPSIENGLNMWIVSDNLRKGAALNTVQIAECLINRGLIQKAA